MTKKYFLFLVIACSLSAFAKIDEKRVSLAMADFTTDSRSNIAQRDLIFYTQYVTNLLSEKSECTIKSRFEVGRIFSDPSIPRQQVLREIGLRTDVDAVMSADVKRDSKGKLVFTFFIVGVKNTERDEFTFLYDDTELGSMKQKFYPVINETDELADVVVNGRPIYYPPNFKKISVGFDASGIGYDNVTDVHSRNNYMFACRYRVYSGNFSFSLSRYLFASISGAYMIATDRYAAAPIDPVNYPEHYQELITYFGNNSQGVPYFDLIQQMPGRNGTFLRDDSRAYFIGGGLGFRAWRLRFSGQYLVPTTKVNKDEKVNDAFPKSLITGGMDIYLLTSIYAGVNIVYSNDAGVIDYNLAQLYPDGIPDEFINHSVGLRRERLLILTLKLGVEL